MSATRCGSDVIVVGGGVVGLTIARELALASLQVTLLDRQAPGREASWAGAGIFPPTYPGSPDSPLVQLTAASHALWPALSDDLREKTGIDNGYHVCGGITLDPSVIRTPEESYRQGQTPSLESQIDAWRQAGARLEPLGASDLQRLEPQLASAESSAGFLLPDLSQVRNPWHLQALIADCRRLGVDLRTDTPVRDVRSVSRGEAVVTLDHEQLSASNVVVAAGAWTPTVLESLPNIPRIEPVRGQIVLLRLPRPVFTHVIECGNRYLVPRADGRVLVGATEELAGFEKQTTVSAVTGLMRFAVELMPALERAEVERAWAGLRPHSATELPLIGPLPGAENILLAAGHFRAGLHLSPITALLIRQLLLHQPLALPLAAFHPRNARDAAAISVAIHHPLPTTQ